MDYDVKRVYKYILGKMADISTSKTFGVDYTFKLEWWSSAWNREYRTFYIVDDDLWLVRNCSGSIHEHSHHEYDFYDMDGRYRSTV